MTHSRWHVTQLTPDAAVLHDRRVYNVPDGTYLGWTPYTHRVTYGAISNFATIGDPAFERELQHRMLRVIEWTPWKDGVRSAYLQDAVSWNAEGSF